MSAAIVATLPEAGLSNGRNLSPQKETIRAYTVIGIGKSRSDVVEVATARWYMSRSADGASPIYCSLWVNVPGVIHAAGHGRARGYGYHKASAALGDAIQSAGITLSKDIDGVGDTAMDDALHAIGIACGFDTVRVIRSC